MPQSIPQWLAILSRADELFYGGAAGGGKALDIETKLPTPTGWLMMGDAEVGDVVFDDNGAICNVMAVSNIMADRPCYKLTFSDGAEMIADKDHRWQTMTAANRNALHKRTEQYRKQRRKTRKNRGIGKRPDLVIMNKSRSYSYLPMPSGEIKTTKEICGTLKISGRTNHSIKVCGGLKLPELDYKIPPYIMGAWLGDGSSYKAEITTVDQEILDEIKLHYDIARRTEITYGIYGLLTDLKSLNLIGNKHIPPMYLRGSELQRLELLQGLMDTDGHCNNSGQNEFCTTKKCLATGMLELLSSLGIKASIVEGRAKLYKKDCGPKYTLKYLTDLPVYKLGRKLSRQKRDGFRGTHERRYIVSVEPTESVPVKCIAVDSESHLYLAGQSMIPTHNTDLVIGTSVECHQHSAIFRRVYPNLSGIMRRTREVINQPKWENKADRIWTFPDGRTIEFGAVQYEADKTKWQGRAHDLKAFDELPEFTESQYLFISGFNRTTDPGQRVRVISTGNPPLNEAGNWIIKRWGAWLDDKHPNPAEPGELRWYATVGGEETEFPNGDPVEVEGETIYPRSRTFIPARVTDNPFYSHDHRYISVLQALPEPLRSMLLYGDFRATAAIDPWQVIPTEWVLLAQERWMEREKPTGVLTCVGIDPARGGRDNMAMSKRYDNYFDELVAWPGAITTTGPKSAELIRQAIGEERPLSINVDVIGYGASTYDSLCGIYPEVRAVNAAGKSEYRDKSGKLKMRNVRAEYYWRMRDALDPAGNEDIALPPGNEIVADLCSARYNVTTSGVLIEMKKDIKKRIGRSPDKGEAILLSNFLRNRSIDLEDLGKVEGYETRWK